MSNWASNKTKTANGILITAKTLGLLALLGVVVSVFLMDWVAGLIILAIPALFLLIAWAVDNSDSGR